ncbi:MAG TPA: 3-deoxy-D-manno-octulosonic acid transferase [Lutibacter sp.]|nr:3-deoxy-D-manno-octulosonic acid transferase [Lutibacter sp.]
MQFLYNLVIQIARLFIPIFGLFSSKMHLFYKGRKETFFRIDSVISKEDQTIWMHCASLGEFEQGRPVLEKLRLEYPNHKLVLSFFSPSGYEVRKDYKVADVVVYLPLDTRSNVKKFLKKVQPSLAIFIKYEFWPNLLAELHKQKIPTLLVSGIFRENQVFFKKNKKWFRESLKAFTHFFVQNKDSVKLLNSIGYNNVSLSGDTRFDRVYSLIQHKKELELVALFTQNNPTLVAGSTWGKDETILINYINTKASDSERFIIAPHNIKPAEIEKLTQNITKKTLRYSKATPKNIQQARVLIIDSIGLLTSVYSYGNIAYVGGGFGAGIHNILEPATYGMPILIGPNYQKFQEALDLIEKMACFEIQTQENLNEKLQEFFTNKEKATTVGKIAKQYILDNIGAADKVLEYVKEQINP